MIRIAFLLFSLFIFQIDGMNPVEVAHKVISLNTYHQRNVSGVFVLPKGKLKKEEMGEVYLELDDSTKTYEGEKFFLRRNLGGISGFLRRTNPKFSDMTESASDLLVLDAYISAVCNQPAFPACSPILQCAVLYLSHDIHGRDFFAPDDKSSSQFLQGYENSGLILREALRDFLCKNGYKSETVDTIIRNETANLCTDHMLEHFINSDDAPGKVFTGYFVTSVLGDKSANTVTATDIVNGLFNANLNEVALRLDRNEPNALIVYKNFAQGEVTNLGKVFAGTPIIAFSTSARGDVFFPTNWVKAIIRFKRSRNGVLKISLVSVYPDAIGFSRGEALGFQKNK